jgi:hypothetical protein
MLVGDSVMRQFVADGADDAGLRIGPAHRADSGGLAIGTSLLTGCATARSDAGTCLPVPTYSREFLARAAGEVGKLPAGSAVEQMLGDYGVVRAQARTCR